MFRFIAHQAAVNPAALALLAPHRQPLTYARLNAEVYEQARLLRGIGINQTDRVALFVPNGPEAALSFLATSAVAICAPLNPVFASSEFDAALSSLQPKALIADPNLSPELRAIVEKRGIILVTATPDADREAGVSTLSVSAKPTDTSDILPDPNDIALLLHTSGTTSQPKLVGLTHGQLCRSAENIARSLQLTPRDRCLNIMPLFHIHGIVAAILSTLSAGASVVCTSGLRGRLFSQWLQDFQPTWFTAVPTMHSAILAQALQRGIAERHSLRFIRSCSAPLPRPLSRDLEKCFDVPVIEAYGMTEASHQIASNPLPPGIRKPGSVGLSAGTEIAIFDELGQPVAPNCEGEIAIRGSCVISNYIGNPSVGEDRFNEGWFHTGDRGLIDQDGYLFIKGRASEFINRGGTKISPHEIEEVLLDHPDVSEAVAFAIPESRLGEEVGAAVVLREPNAAAEIELLEFVSRKLSYFKVPRHIAVLDKIPKGPTGKLQRIGLAAQLGLTAPQKALSQGTTVQRPRTELEELLAAMWGRIIGVEKMGLDDDFFQMGGDSLAAMELITATEHVTGQKLTIAALFEAPTIRQFAKLIERRDPDGCQYVVPIQSSGSESPFFCVDGGPRYRNLARRLGTKRPVLGLIYPLEVATSVEAIATFCVNSILAVEPDGPYLLGGWCTAGLIAYEIAQQLRSRGREVALLVLFDAVNPGRLDGLSRPRVFLVQADEFFRKVLFHLRSIARLEPENVFGYLFERLKNVWRTATRRSWLARATIQIAHQVSRTKLPGVERLGRRYRPTPYDGRVVLVRRSLRAISTYLDWKLGWGALINGELDVLEVQGGHSDMLDEPQVRATAVGLTRYFGDDPKQNVLRPQGEPEPPMVLRPIR
jgi:oxalate---CoA ligase